jgi:hypothetical protein
VPPALRSFAVLEQLEPRHDLIAELGEVALGLGDLSFCLVRPSAIRLSMRSFRLSSSCTETRV